MALLLGLSVFALVGCTDTPDEAGANHATALEAVLKEADQQGIGPEAREVIASAIEANRVITDEEARAGLLATADCISDLGFRVRTFEDSQTSGGMQLVYGLSGQHDEFPEEMEQAAYACEARHWTWLDTAYQVTHARSPEGLEEAFAPYRAAMVECVQGRGGVVAADAPAQEIIRIDQEIARDDGLAELCTAKIGIDQVLERAW